MNGFHMMRGPVPFANASEILREGRREKEHPATL